MITDQWPPWLSLLALYYKKKCIKNMILRQLIWNDPICCQTQCCNWNELMQCVPSRFYRFYLFRALHQGPHHILSIDGGFNPDNRQALIHGCKLKKLSGLLHRSVMWYSLYPIGKRTFEREDLSRPFFVFDNLSLTYLTARFHCRWCEVDRPHCIHRTHNPRLRVFANINHKTRC